MPQKYKILAGPQDIASPQAAAGGGSIPAAGSLIVAFDIDGTWSLDPPTWRKIYDLMYDGRWMPIIVTGSHQPEDKLRRLLVPVDAIIVVSGPLLKEEAARRAGYKVAVWIDDMPGMIQECRILGGDLDSENAPHQATASEKHG